MAAARLYGEALMVRITSGQLHLRELEVHLPAPSSIQVTTAPDPVLTPTSRETLSQSTQRTHLSQCQTFDRQELCEPTNVCGLLFVAVTFWEWLVIQQEMTNTPGVIRFQPLRAWMMQHFLNEFFTIMARNFLHANDILFCKFCCRYMSRSNCDRQVSWWTTNVRHPNFRDLKTWKNVQHKSNEIHFNICLLFPFCSHQPPLFTKTLI